MTTAVRVKVVMGDFVAEEDIVPGHEAEGQVRLEFNPSMNREVAVAKALMASAVRYTDEAGNDPRLTALSKTAIEEASMWMVKSVTAKEAVPKQAA